MFLNLTGNRQFANLHHLLQIELQHISAHSFPYEISAKHSALYKQNGWSTKNIPYIHVWAAK